MGSEPVTSDPTAWIGETLGSHLAGNATLRVSLPPSEPTHAVVSLTCAPLLDRPDQTGEDVFIRVNLAGARNLQRALGDAIAQLEEHDGS